MLRSGRVVKEETNGVLVRFERLAACAGCGACGRDTKTTTVFVHGEAKIGDVVSVQMPDAQILNASLVAYLVPLAGFIGGLFLANWLGGGNELWMLAGGIGGLALGAFIIKRVDKRLGVKSSWQAKVLSVNDPEAIAELNGEAACPKTTSWSQ